MTANYAQHLNPKATPQSKPIPGKTMVKNAAGAYAFAVDDWARARRFLILGTEGGTYYQSEGDITIENAQAVQRCEVENPERLVNLIVEVSDQGLAPKNDAAIFALALMSVSIYPRARRLAFDNLRKVCRIGTHLFQFVKARETLGGGWGRTMRYSVVNWYDRPDMLMQLLKFQNREGWTHRDIFRLAHPKVDHIPAAVAEAVCRPEKWNLVNHELVNGYCAVRAAKTAKEAAAIVNNYRLPREFVPTEFLNSLEVWDALLPQMPMTALVRNLGNMSKVGLLKPLSEAAKLVATKLRDQKLIQGARLHPFAVLVASKTYSSGHSVRGSGSWTVVPQVTDALEDTFELAFKNVEPTGLNYALGIDVSGSMGGGWSGIQGVLSPAECAAAMALVTARIEANYVMWGFQDRLVDLKITAKDTMPTVLAKTRNMNFGATDATKVFKWATDNRAHVDAFCTYSDGDSWAGQIHVCQALAAYRQATGVGAKHAMVNFTASKTSLADPGDFGSMDFVGMDASLPQAINAFLMG